MSVPHATDNEKVAEAQGDRDVFTPVYCLLSTVYYFLRS